jgi:hypothetical protein
MARRLTLSFDDLPTLERALERRLLRGEANVPGVTGIEAFTPCELVLRHPAGSEMTIGATVMSSPADQEAEGHVRLMLDAGHESALKEFVARSDGPAAPAPKAASSEPEDAAHVEEKTASEASASMPPPLRLRQLTVPEQIKLARKSPSLTERVALEKILGRSGWDPLLRNHHITIPEVARIARKGTVPRPLIENIVNNQSWTRAPTVRRALLTNPKLSPELILKVLRLAPASELKLMLKQTAYPASVRTVAERLTGKD